MCSVSQPSCNCTVCFSCLHLCTGLHSQGGKKQCCCVLFLLRKLFQNLVIWLFIADGFGRSWVWQFVSGLHSILEWLRLKDPLTHGGFIPKFGASVAFCLSLWCIIVQSHCGLGFSQYLISQLFIWRLVPKQHKTKASSWVKCYSQSHWSKQSLYHPPPESGYS